MNHRRRRQQQQAIAHGCEGFFIDVGIEQGAAQFYHKWRTVAQNYHRLLRKKVALERAVQQNLALQIHKRVSKYHVLSGIEIEIASVPFFLWQKMMKQWPSYVPQRKKSHFTKYHKTHLASKFFTSFPAVQKDKLVAPGMVMRITISKAAPARAMYDSKAQKMLLTFWYEPYPFVTGWYPLYKGVKTPQNHCKVRCYWQEKEVKIKTN